MAKNKIQILIQAEDKASKAFGKVNDKALKMGKSLKKLALPMVAIGAGLAALGAKAAQTAIDFETSFAGVRKTVDATEEQFAELAQGFRDMSKEIPVNVNELNRIGEAAGQLGIKTENIIEFTETMAMLGVTTNMSAEEAATSLARLANIMQIPQDRFDEMGSVIVALGNNLATTEGEIVEMALRLAGAGKQVGLTEDQVLSFAGALSSVGIQAQAGGTAFSRVFIDMASAVGDGIDESNDALITFSEVSGTTMEEFSRMFREDAAGAMIAFVEGLGQISDTGGDLFGVLEQLGLSEVRVRDALLRASGAGDLFAESMRIGAEATRENSALTDEAAKRFETMASKIQILKNRMSDVALSIGEQMMPQLNELIEKFSEPATIASITKFATVIGKVFTFVLKTLIHAIRGFLLFKNNVEIAILGIRTAHELAFLKIAELGLSLKRFTK